MLENCDQCIMEGAFWPTYSESFINYFTHLAINVQLQIPALNILRLNLLTEKGF